MRFVLRFASLLALVLAVIAGTIDSIRSVAASSMVLTPLQEAWQQTSPATLAALRSSLAYYIHPYFYSVILGWLMAQPAFAVLLLLALLLWMAGYRRALPAGRFAA